MISLFLLIVAAIVLALGYRYYSKLLALWVFGLQANYSTPARERADDTEFFATNKHVVFGHHFAIVAGATTLAGTGVAVIWGWIPAFLWVVAGTAVAGGTYALGSMWLAVRHNAQPLPDIAAAYMGSRATTLFLALTLPLLLLVNATLVWLGAELLATHPAAVAPFWVQLAIAMGISLFLYRSSGTTVLSVSLVALVVSWLTLWLLSKLLFAFSGELNIDIRGHSLLSFDATVVWLILLLVSTFYVVRQAVWKLMQPRGYLVAIHTGVLLALLFIAMVVRHPTIVAPNFSTPTTGPGVMPWIFVTLTSGAIAGFYVLFATGITGRQLAYETDARYVGYGVALAEGVLALSVILISVAGFSTAQEWTSFYASWKGIQSLPKLADLYIDGFAFFTQAIGIPGGFARMFAAFVIISLIAATLDAGIRLQQELLTALARRYPLPRLGDQRTALLTTLVLVAAFALYEGHGRGALALWPLFGYWNQILAVAGFVLMAFALHRQGRAPWPLVVLALLLLALGTWALLWQLALWWTGGNWLLLAFGASLLVLTIWLTWEALRAVRQAVAAARNA
jgi:carbon starvation protein